MRKLFVIALFLAVLVSVSAQSYEFKFDVVDPARGESVSQNGLWFIKDGAWVSDGKDHIILGSAFDKGVTDDGHTFFAVAGIDWDGDECVVSLTNDLPNGKDGLLISWSDDQYVWYYGKLEAVDE